MREGFLRCRGIEAEADCASPKAQRFLKNWNEKLVVREVERKGFFSRRTAIFTLFRKLL